MSSIRGGGGGGGGDLWNSPISIAVYYDYICNLNGRKIQQFIITFSGNDRFRIQLQIGLQTKCLEGNRNVIVLLECKERLGSFTDGIPQQYVAVLKVTSSPI